MKNNPIKQAYSSKGITVLRYLISLWFSIALLFVLPSISKGQQVNIDSLILLLDQSKSDTATIHLYSKISEAYRNKNADSATYFIQIALRKAKEIGYNKGLAMATSTLGNIYFDKADYEMAKLLWLESIGIAEMTGQIKVVADNYTNIGHLFNFYYKRNSDSCQKYYQRALAVYDTLKNLDGMATIYNGLANNFYYQENYDEAIILYKKALKQFEDLHKPEGIGHSYNNIGLIYFEQGSYTQSLDYLHKAAEYYQTSGNRNNIANNANTLGLFYTEIFDYKNAEKYLTIALDLYKEIKNPLYLSMVYDNFGLLYNSQKKYRLALETYKTGLSYDLEAKNVYYIASSYSIIAQTYLDLGLFDSAFYFFNKSQEVIDLNDYPDIKTSVYLGLVEYHLNQNNFKDAIQLGEQILISINETQQLPDLVTITGLLSSVYAESKNYKKAYEYQKIYDHAKDSLFDEEKLRTIAGKEFEYTHAKEKREQELLAEQKQKIFDAEKKRQGTIRNFLILVAIILLLFVVYGYWTYQNKKKDNAALKAKNETIDINNRILNKQADELIEANATKDKFFSIIAHDLKNPLSAMIGISDLLEGNYENLEEDKKRQFISLISQSSTDLYKLLENLLEWSRAQRGGIAFNPVKFYLADAVDPVVSLLQTAALKKQLNIHNQIDKKTAVFADFSMVTTIIRNLVSNAIKFTHENGNIFIFMDDFEGKSRICIKDEGVGISETDQLKLFRLDRNYSKKGTSGESGTGLGLLLCKEFVDKNRGEIGVESNLNEGSTFWFTLAHDNFY